MLMIIITQCSDLFLAATNFHPSVTRSKCTVVVCIVYEDKDAGRRSI
jgi:hypothetical protein